MRGPWRKRAAGFTLVEVLTALAIFGVIGVMATRILTGMIELGSVAETRGAALADLQRAMDIVERDVEQSTTRTVRDEFGDPLPAVSMADGSLLELTRMGWRNPLGAPRAELQRVAYLLREDKLLRLFWPVLDRAPDTKPVAQILLRGVAEARFAAHDEAGEEHGHWPPPPPADGTPMPGLAALEMHLDLSEQGRITRLWLVPGGREFDFGQSPAEGVPGSDPEAEREGEG